jgi:hypothetical protein
VEEWKKTYLRLFCGERSEGLLLLNHFRHTVTTVPSVRVFSCCREGSKILTLPLQAFAVHGSPFAGKHYTAFTMTECQPNLFPSYFCVLCVSVVKFPLDRRPVIVAIAGPNGAGKTTFFHSHLREAGLRFI